VRAFFLTVLALDKTSASIAYSEISTSQQLLIWGSGSCFFPESCMAVRKFTSPGLMLVVFLSSALTAQADTILQLADVAIAKLKSVEPGGKGTAEARTHVAGLAGAGPKALVPILKGFSGANRLGANWLRNAFEENVGKIKASGGKLPKESLEAFVMDTKQSPLARRLAYETIKAEDVEKLQKEASEKNKPENPKEEKK
jgi:hypothetical protein